MNYKKILKAALMLMLPFSLTCQAQHIETLQQGKPTSIRGLSVVDDNTAWVSGSHGYFATTKDGGTTWDWHQIKGFEKSDFRDVEAFSAKDAIVMSSGTPAVILKTSDGGASWKECYRKTDTTYFLDAMDFDDKKHGFILGDPIGGKFLLLETKDGGDSWHQFANLPDAAPGEAAFAASGTCLRFSNDWITIVTGGLKSHCFYLHLTEKGPVWQSKLLPFSNKSSSVGAFSVASQNARIVFVGGDYAHDKQADSTACFVKTLRSLDWEIAFPDKGPAGYQSCVEAIGKGNYLSTGTPGTNIITDDGRTWKQIDAASYNVCRKAKKGKLVLLAGDKGRIGIFKL